MKPDTTAALQQIQTAIGQAQDQLSDPTLPATDRQMLQKALVSLMTQEDALELASLQAMVDKLNSSNTALHALVADMQKSSAKIAAFADTINKVVGVVNILSQAATKAISAGLV